MTDNILTWNVRNWITVFLMFFAGWAAFALIIRVGKGMMGHNSAGSDTDA